MKSTTRLLMDNIGADGDLNNDMMVRALLTQRNTPDAGCKLSPAQLLFGRPLKDTLPYLTKNVLAFTNPQVSNQWRKILRMKEETMRSWYWILLKQWKRSRNTPGASPPLTLVTMGSFKTNPATFLENGTAVELSSNQRATVSMS